VLGGISAAFWGAGGNFDFFLPEFFGCPAIFVDELAGAGAPRAFDRHGQAVRIPETATTQGRPLSDL
jgi:hypothetical protein